MNYPVCPLDNIIVKLEKKFQDEIVTPGGLKLYIAAEFNLGEYATVTGTVVSLPRGVGKYHEIARVIQEARVGEEIFFSYLVVYNLDQRFSYPVYENELTHDGESYWKVHYPLVLGYIRDGKIIPASGYVYIDPVEPALLPEKSSGGLWIPDMARRPKDTPIQEGIVKAVGVPFADELPLPVKPGDKVIYEKRFLQKYKVSGQNICLLTHDRILGKKRETKTMANTLANGS